RGSRLSSRNRTVRRDGPDPEQSGILTDVAWKSKICAPEVSPGCCPRPGQPYDPEQYKAVGRQLFLYCATARAPSGSIRRRLRELSRLHPDLKVSRILMTAGPPIIRNIVGIIKSMTGKVSNPGKRLARSSNRSSRSFRISMAAVRNDCARGVPKRML